ncbi:glycosyltransferase [Klebsiella michiganensis]|uniref:glycosyltransferase n=1 Tax=Klebsiella michiganensis TaxID=1134687 RepID=UPI0015E4C661|nr:glycosyltransferase [Klebsiella michiganensis]QLP48986.1 glycosyltransferase [Klebsiella michiganensis]
MNVNHKRKVSIYIPTSNRLKKLKRAIQSVLSQDYKNIEILICDDASNDGTKEYVESLMATDCRIRYFRSDENRGACYVRNLGIYNATGYFITGLDDDDEFKSNRVSYFIDNWDDKFSFICCNFYDCYVDGKTKSYYKHQDSVLKYTDLLFSNKASNQVFTLTERMKVIGGFDVRVKRYQDWDTWLRLSFKFGDFLRLGEPTYVMHHDHVPNEKRVSKSYSSIDALSELRERNDTIYVGEYLDFMNFLISQMKGTCSFKDSLRWSLIQKKPRHLIRFFLRRYLKNND